MKSNSVLWQQWGITDQALWKRERLPCVFSSAGAMKLGFDTEIGELSPLDPVSLVTVNQ